ncbi:hypothetical protein TL16_g00772 [Triparma laevis f. inornata]|uniref:Tyrosine-protein kinase ephrin type A/B receptor-like domain-containing protein n=1 Tax=Triparma laevis f. inornata TaxID=1714386 RepID=A0A9W6ZDV2_9STRA|nr:hypothetical protein TL16_g00772 [Triparma laevis f. inornata]
MLLPSPLQLLPLLLLPLTPIHCSTHRVSSGTSLVSTLASSNEGDDIILTNSASTYTAISATAEAAFAFPHPLNLICETETPCKLSGSDSWGVLMLFTGTSSYNTIANVIVKFGNRIAGGGAYCQETKVSFINVKFIDSTSGSNYYGGGLYVRDGSHVSLEHCVLCEPGKYNDVEGAAECDNCGSNYFSSTPGSTSCTICFTGRYSLSSTVTSSDFCRYYAPNSIAEITTFTVIAGQPKIIPLSLKDNTDAVMQGSLGFDEDWVMVTANSTITSVAYNRTFTNGISNIGEYSTTSSNQPQISLTFDAAVDWSVQIRNPLNLNHFKNSPLTIKVLPSISTVSSMKMEFPVAITAGDRLFGKIKTFYEFLNPTFSSDDDILWWLSFDSDGDKFSAVPKPLSKDYYVSSELLLVAGSYRLHCSINDEELSPIGFLVLPAEVDASESTHNLLNVNFVDSTLATTWEVEVIPRDRYGNLIIDVGGDGDVWFTLELETEGADSPITINVLPAPVDSLVPLYVGICSTLLLMPLSIFVYKKAASRGIERDLEKKLSADERLLEMIQNRIKRQYFWLAVETIDVLSDMLNFLVVVVSGVPLGSVQFILFLGVACMSCPTGIYGAFMRLRIISGYHKIQDGDAQTLEIYAKSVCHTADMSEITVDNLLIRLDMMAMDLTVIEIALRGMLLEDFPSALINLGFVVSNGDLSLDNGYSLFPLFAGLVSVFLIGRKSGLLDKRNEVIEVKREVEEALEKEEEGDGGAGAGVVRNLSAKLMTEVFGKEAKAAHTLRQGSSKQRVVRQTSASLKQKRQESLKLESVLPEPE